MPPAPTYAMLRDSCVPMAAAAEIALDDDEEIPVETDEAAVTVRGDDKLAAKPVADDDVPWVTLSVAELQFMPLDQDSEALVSAMNGVLTLRAVAASVNVRIERAREAVRSLVFRGVVRLR